MRFTILVLMALLLCPMASGATVTGLTYDWETLEHTTGVVVEVNSTPTQQMVSKNNGYSFFLSPGGYLITAALYENGQLVLYAEEPVSIVDDGEYTIDLLLLPPLPEDDIIEELPEFEADLGISKDENTNLILILISAILIAILIILYKIMKKPSSKKMVVPEDLNKLLEIIKSSGGRMTQKELRIKLNLSEAKISLMVSDLENRGLVEKFKRGRGNIVRLTDDAKI